MKVYYVTTRWRRLHRFAKWVQKVAILVQRRLEKREEVPPA